MARGFILCCAVGKSDADPRLFSTFVIPAPAGIPVDPSVPLILDAGPCRHAVATEPAMELEQSVPSILNAYTGMTSQLPLVCRAFALPSSAGDLLL